MCRPLGGIWYLEKGKEEVVVCLVEELEVLRRKWEGSGKGGWRYVLRVLLCFSGDDVLEYGFGGH